MFSKKSPAIKHTVPNCQRKHDFSSFDTVPSEQTYFQWTLYTRTATTDASREFD